MRKGRKSLILKGKTSGGMITVRMPTQLHLEFATLCNEKDISMNQQIVELIEKEVKDGQQQES